MHRKTPALAIAGFWAILSSPALGSPEARAQKTPTPAAPEADSQRLQLERTQKQAVARKRPGKPSNQERKAQFERERIRILSRERGRDEKKKAKIRARFQSMVKPQASLGPTPDPCTSPKITVIDAYGALDAGDEVLVNGCGFGPKHSKSELRLVGNFPGGHLKMEVLDWYGYAIRARVPITTSDTGDSQKAKLQVLRSDLKLSNQWPVDYQPWIVGILPSQAVKVSCGAGGGAHNCATIPPKPGEWLGSLGAVLSSTFGATHGSPPSSASDTVTSTLKNGWLFAGYAWWWWYQKGGSGYVSPPSGFQSWSPSLSIKMPWGAWSSSEVAYQVDVYVMGPKGTSPY